MEQWKNYYVKNYGNIVVSNFGNVINKNGKILHFKIDSDGYYYIRVHFNNYRDLMKKNEVYMFQKRVHRLVAILFVDNPNNYVEVNHIDGIKKNNHFDNLEWCTRSHNVQHAFDNGLKFGSKGSKNGRAVLKEEDVVKIRIEFEQGKPISEIAKRYGIGWTTVSHIVLNETWKHV